MKSKYLNILYSSVGVYAEFFIGFIISIILSRYFSTNEYGIYTFVNSVITLLVIFINGGISLSAIRLVSKFDNDPYRIDQTVKQLKTKLNIRNAILTVVAIFYFIFFYGGNDITEKAIICFMAGSFFKAQYIFLVSVQKGAERFDLIAKTTLILGLLNLIYILVAVYLKQPIEIFFLIYLVTSLSFYILSSYFNDKYVLKKYYNDSQNSGAEILNELSIVKPLAIISLFSFFVMKQSEIFFLKVLTTNENVALFSIPFNLYIAITTLIPGILLNVLLPIFSKQKGTNSESKKLYLLEKSIRYISYLTIPITAYVYVFSEEIIVFIYGDKYYESAFVLSIIIIGLYVGSSIAVFNSYMISTNRANLLMWITIISSILTLALDYTLISLYSLDGAAWGFLSGLLSMYFVYMIFYGGFLVNKIDFIFSAKLIFVSAISAYLVRYIDVYPGGINICVTAISYLLLISLLAFIFNVLDREENKLIRAFAKQYF